MTCDENIDTLQDILEKYNIYMFGIFKAATQTNATNYNSISVL